MSGQELLVRPVIIGGDIGAYGSARAFHEAYGCTTVVLAGVSTGPVAHSAIIDLRIVAGLDDDATLVASLTAVLAERPNLPHLLLGSADHAVHALVRVRDRLPANAVIPYADAATMDQATTKAGFSRLCAELEIPHPQTTVHAVGEQANLDGVRYPAVVKASSSAEFHKVEFAGKRKVSYVQDAAELRALLDAMAAAGFDGEVVIQERIDGGDEQMATVNAFCGPATARGVRFLLFGQVLLEEATPNGLGNSVAQITGGTSAHDEAVGHAQRLLNHVGWTGFANLDLKRDPRTGQYLFFELNPRVGRSGYAVTAAGYNVARMYGEAYLESELAPSAAIMGENEHLFAVVPLGLLKRYVSASTWQRVLALKRRGAVTNVFYYRRETNPRRWFYIATAMLNQVRKFRRWHT